MLLKNGCPGCEKEWNAPYAEGQCSRCKRCLQCCGKVKVALSCSAKHAAKTAPQQARSKAAYDRWESNVAILGHNRRIV